ncbi:hypothetical protein I7I50_11491 [Histoplasma capsulatum G186AR]|uniref:Secreted protein n=1 Tax=Ajellomyces capsulatus TaxID=5037 RepID=A0A8H7Z8Z7_AJECA|nr:hypothetical protein I7I52_02728 [Histoplasma capsulatum]QSS70001.1 hypothetical protein I7I50_11491 [Histoplasma capsulatum G186AR]
MCPSKIVCLCTIKVLVPPTASCSCFKSVSLCSTTGCESHAAKQELPLQAGPEEHRLRRNWKRMG